MAEFPTTAIAPEIARRNGVTRAGSRVVPEEVPIAFSYGGSTHAVMMGSPADLEDFAVGFSLTEGIITSMAEIESISVVEEGAGLDVQVTLLEDKEDALRARRRHMAGPVGCGLCGIESIEQAMRPVPDVSAVAMALSPKEVSEAVAALNSAQPLHRETHAVHGAGFYRPGKGLAAVREDVGRHNALDKLAGAVIREGIKGSDGVVVVTSRISVEMVQKTAILGSPVLIAISAPTALAIRTAQEAGMTLIALTRGEDFEIFTRTDRITTGVVADVA
ncbi:formate dehydrogenase accessory sulfurtransferase FdhD [Neorhizobium galegae]|uniref:formate dehydrogenase accessory sulfurtransferase FdhD n=1 Tax=Neorhizobium galegae TaxID=399 RepID=UPI0006276BD0|nr:formate dehydrogenase accessory sulfurtransferase FdhD [Neorhizobium galegae]KAA9389094.1 formate dehydrogenase accessory sulfurtransferase FdhD [Neorhizobium galegae]KAB1116475.1 formate dehydrogenase accessory sulfurtransferase FdhD [Neorhizobium galegae]MCM2498152.1 formate dehydrogenase accessory sulfurtransferase FdhD [Neorhizobium galegae]MCQ1774634.1 formate dehydrogenase accessory sulfurtransferase FdhD [Neorhizobium galegae]MCQ1781020.1 formate dehydrogenase accessory sulfurtransfe